MIKMVRLAALLILFATLFSGCVASATPASGPSAPATSIPTQAPAPQLTPTVTAPTAPAAPSQAVPTAVGGTIAAPGGTGGPQVVKGKVLLDFKGVAYDPATKQAVLNLTGNLPTPCHKLQTDVSAPDAQNHITVSVYTLVDANVICTQVIKPFETAVPLGTLAAGSYSVSVNGDQVGDVKVP